MQQLQPFHVAGLVMEHSSRILLHGLPSTGKSYLAHRWGLRPNQRVYSITLEEDMSSADLLGCWMLREREMVWHHGTGVSAWLDGARLVIDELDHASAEVRSFLHRLLDDPEFAQLKLPSGEIVRPARGFQVVATMNGDPEDLPEALRSRFPVTIHITEPNPEAIDALPTDLRSMATTNACHADEHRRIPLRVWYEFAKLRQVLGLEVAAQACFRGRAQEVVDALRLAAAGDVAEPASEPVLDVTKSGRDMSFEEFEATYLRYCRAGQKIQAIKLRRDRYDESIADAKGEVDATITALAESTGVDWVELDVLIHAGQTAKAIKSYRERYDASESHAEYVIECRKRRLFDAAREV